MLILYFLHNRECITTEVLDGKVSRALILRRGDFVLLAPVSATTPRIIAKVHYLFEALHEKKEEDRKQCHIQLFM